MASALETLLACITQVNELPVRFKTEGAGHEAWTVVWLDDPNGTMITDCTFPAFDEDVFGTPRQHHLVNISGDEEISELRVYDRHPYLGGRGENLLGGAEGSFTRLTDLFGNYLTVSCKYETVDVLRVAGRIEIVGLLRARFKSCGQPDCNAECDTCWATFPAEGVSLATFMFNDDGHLVAAE